MAVDKLVDSTQLDTDLTSVANAIRTKGGTSASLAFPAGFVSAVEAIETGGGGYSADTIADHAIDDTISITKTTIKNYSFYGQPLAGVTSTGTTSINSYAFAYCRPLGTCHFSEVTTLADHVFTYAGDTSLASSNCIIVLPKLTTMSGKANFDRGNFVAVDIGPDFASLPNDQFYHNTAKQTVGALILRRTGGVVSSGNVDGLKGLRDVWIPHSLYTHLGDGSSLDYQAATNWSTRYTDGYLTFHDIQGSDYETKYADGTTIPT